jgi:tetratricopeptide (TPR) repeat protein/tRNA A-37 threonylcarbamoyl transferase component Bud32
VESWRAGLRIPAECYLDLHPTVRADEEGAFGLIYGEFALRESLGESPLAEEFVRRFPAYAERLRRQLAIHDALGEELAAEAPLAAAMTQRDSLLRTPGRTPAAYPEIEGFEILTQVGRGGMGVVYKARQTDLNRLVALKVIRLDACDHSEIERFRAEAEAVARFQHPNIVQVFGVGEQTDLGYLALEYAAGGSLQASLAGAPQTAQYSAALLEPLARAVHYAHERGIVHRDLKPANVVLTEDGTPKVTDFGLAKLMEHSRGPTRTGDILGTPSYMAPEQARAAGGKISPATDVYALGAILYELLTGRPPFQGSTPLSTLAQVASLEPLPPSRIQRHIPRDVETICLKCLEKDPRRRYTTAEALADDLRRFLAGHPIAARPVPAWVRAGKWARRRPVAATALVSGAVSLLVLLGGTLAYHARLQAALKAARIAERAALHQRNLALNAFNSLIFGVQETLGDSTSTRKVRGSLLKTAIAGLEEIARGTEAAAPDPSRAVAHAKLGDIYRQIGRAVEARAQYEKARRLAEQLAEAAPGDLDVADCLARACTGLGELDVSAGRPVEAKGGFRHAVALFEAIWTAAPGREDARLNVLQAYMRLGRAHGYAREFAEASAWFRKARDLGARWVAEEPANLQAADLLAWSYRKLADIRKLTNDPRGAQADYMKAIEIGRRMLALDPDDTTTRTHLAIALDDLAEVALTLRDPESTEGLYREAGHLFEGLLAADPENVDLRVRLIHAQADLAYLLENEARFDEAANLFLQAADHRARIEREGQLEGRSTSPRVGLATLRQEADLCSAAAALLNGAP